jgi:hypothetical protein
MKCGDEAVAHRLSVEPAIGCIEPIETGTRQRRDILSAFFAPDDCEPR